MSLFSDLIPGLNTGLQLFGAARSLFGGGHLANQGQGYYDEAIKNARNGYADALKMYQDRQSAGDFNAANALAQAGQQSAHDLALQDKNTAGQLATLGYKRGDSPFQQGAAQNSEGANLALQQRLLDTKRMFAGDQQNAFNNVEGYRQNLNNALMNVGGQNIQNGLATQQGGLRGLGAMFMGGFGGQNQQPRRPWDERGNDPFNQARGDFNPFHQYDSNGNLLSNG
jgi:hypothetical protein